VWDNLTINLIFFVLELCLQSRVAENKKSRKLIKEVKSTSNILRKPFETEAFHEFTSFFQCVLSSIMCCRTIRKNRENVAFSCLSFKLGIIWKIFILKVAQNMQIKQMVFISVNFLDQIKFK
jgi:hypothetical protein